MNLLTTPILSLCLSLSRLAPPTHPHSCLIPELDCEFQISSNFTVVRVRLLKITIKTQKTKSSFVYSKKTLKAKKLMTQSGLLALVESCEARRFC